MIGNKIVCIYHSIDLDGWMSAAIAKHWFNENNFKEPAINNTLPDKIDFIGYNYGQPIPDLSEYDKVIMCDISFPYDNMKHLIDRLGTNFIWIDHHISAINTIQTHLSYDINIPVNGIRDTKFAACELTWMYFFLNETMPEIVRLLGRYDCFGHKFTKEDENRRLTLLEYTKSTNRWMTKEEQDELANLNIKLLEEQKVLEFQYGARQVITNYEEAYQYLTNSLTDKLYTTGQYFDNTLNQIYDSGKAIYKYLCTEAKQVYKNGFVISFKNINRNETNLINHYFICINKERFNPINFGIDYHKDGYDGCACFWYDGKQWKFSLYNDNGLVDCSVIAKQFGGGGHKGAAGFVTDNINPILNLQ